MGRKKHNWLPFEEARKIVLEDVKKYGINNFLKWCNYCKLHQKPNNIPSSPQIIYKNNGWNGFGNWLGTGNVRNGSVKKLNFEEAYIIVKDIVVKNNIKTNNEWSEFCKDENFPNDIPVDPSKFYKNKGWRGWGYWLGTFRKYYGKWEEWCSFKDALIIVRKEVVKYNIENCRDWQKYCISGKKPINIPAYPNIVYKNYGWISWMHWLNNKNSQSERKHDVNHGYLKKWFPDMAYIVGLWWADGYITSCEHGRYGFSITLHKNDKYLLEKILKKMHSDYNVYRSSGNCYAFMIQSREIYNRIIKIGGIPNKSHDIGFPKKIPKKYLPDFIRGHFDGDGCIYFAKHSNKYYCDIGSASKKFIDGLHNILESNNIHNVIYTRLTTPDNPFYSIRINPLNSLKLGSFMYQNIKKSGLKMIRKYKLFQLAKEIN